jgi:hypothetical protein
MSDFSKGDSFIPTSMSDFGAYQSWADEQSCSGCGWKARDRVRGPERPWATETECGYCAEIRGLRMQLRAFQEIK